MRADEALELQAGQVAGLRTPFLHAWLRNWLDERAERLGRESEPNAGVDFAAAVASGLDGAPCFVVSPETNALLRSAAEDLPLSMAIDERDVPAETGFLVFAEPLVVAAREADGSTGTVDIRAISWITGDPDRSYAQVPEQARNILAVVFWTDILTSHGGPGGAPWTVSVGGRDYSRHQLVALMGGASLLPVSSGPVPIGLALEDWSQFMDPERAGEIRTTYPIRVAIAVWKLMRQPILTEVSLGHLAAKARKRLARPHGGEPPAVHVISLRQRPHPERGSSAGDGTRPEWRYRWPVRGHWRRFHVGIGRSSVEERYVHPYMKGPEGAPIRPGSNVWRVAARPGESLQTRG